MKLSIIIVNYNVKHFLQQCLQSVQKAKKNISIEIIVIDNNSVDNSVEMLKENFPKIKLITNKKNQGFSKANNQGIKQSKGEYILLLNPDTVVEENIFKKTLNFLEENPQVGALGVKMFNGKGEFLPESKRSLPTPISAFYKIFGLSNLFPKSKKFGEYHLKYLDKNKNHEVDVLSGAFFMTRKSILEEINFLDERFFMYGEDIDLSYRIQKKGYKNIYFSETSIIHYKGESTKKTSINYIITFYKAMILFVKKHYSKKKGNPLILLINLAILLRATLSIIKRFFLKSFFPLFDILIIFFGLYLIQDIWSEFWFSSKNYYNGDFLKFVVPIYISFWILGIYFQQGYNKPFKIKNLIKGVVSGTLLLLIIYALLPENLRFSRALILFGAGWTILSTFLTRYLLNKVDINFLKTQTEKLKRIIIIANQNEFERICTIINNDSIKQPFIKQLNINQLEQIKEVIEIYKINEIIFSAQDITVQKIIQYMSIIKKNIEIKIAPSESTFIIGSNSIHTQDDLYSLETIRKENNSIMTLIKKYIEFFN